MASIPTTRVENVQWGEGIYTGEVGAGMTPHGQGSVIWSTGTKYEGEWDNGRLHGLGIYIWPSGSIYKGEFKKNKREGKGHYTWANRNQHIGEWKAGSADGKGSFIWATGEKYEGEWKEGKQHGFGIYSWPNGDRYVGSFVDDQRKGKAVYTNALGERYEGEYNEDTRNGPGIKYYLNGTIYECNAKSGVIQGHGQFRFIDGSTILGPGEYPISLMDMAEVFNYARAKSLSLSEKILSFSTKLRGSELANYTREDVNKLELTAGDEGIFSQIINACKEEQKTSKTLLYRVSNPETLREDLKKFLNNSKNSRYKRDYKIIISKQDIYIHKDIIETRAPSMYINLTLFKPEPCK